MAEDSGRNGSSQLWKCRGTVDGGREVEMRIDTGCSRTTIRRSLIKGCKLKLSRLDVTVANGAVVSQGLADVILDLEGNHYFREVAVAENLHVPVLLGNDMPSLKLTLGKMSPEEWRQYLAEGERQELSLTVTTRSQAQAQKAKLGGSPKSYVMQPR